MLTVEYLEALCLAIRGGLIGQAEQLAALDELRIIATRLLLSRDQVLNGICELALKSDFEIPKKRRESKSITELIADADNRGRPVHGLTVIKGNKHA